MLTDYCVPEPDAWGKLSRCRWVGHLMVRSILHELENAARSAGKHCRRLSLGEDQHPHLDLRQAIVERLPRSSAVKTLEDAVAGSRQIQALRAIRIQDESVQPRPRFDHIPKSFVD